VEDVLLILYYIDISDTLNLEVNLRICKTYICSIPVRICYGNIDAKTLDIYVGALQGK
jgi:hypothetical protein